MEFKRINDIQNQIESLSQSLKEQAISKLNEIISLLPDEIKDMINFQFEYVRIPKEYLLSSILFAFSNAIGQSCKLNAFGYTNYGNLFFAIVGNRGDIKSEAIKKAIAPLIKRDSEAYSNGNKNLLENIKNKKIFIQEASIQAAQKAHYYNQYSIGIRMDEMMYLVEKMANKNNSDGMAWKTFLLEGYNNSPIDILRVTSESFRINISYPTLIGTIQDHFIPTLFANGNLDSGLIDRIFYTYKLTDNQKLSKEVMPKYIYENYEKSLDRVYSIRKSIEENSEVPSLELKLPVNSKDLIYDYVQDLIYRQKNENTLNKGYLAKLQISIYKLTIVIHAIKSYSLEDPISLDTVKLAIKINEFYLINFKIICSLNERTYDKKTILRLAIREAIKNKAKQTDIINVFGIPKSTISRIWNDELNNIELGTNK